MRLPFTYCKWLDTTSRSDISISLTPRNVPLLVHPRRLNIWDCGSYDFLFFHLCLILYKHSFKFIWWVLKCTAEEFWKWSLLSKYSLWWVICSKFPRRLVNYNISQICIKITGQHVGLRLISTIDKSAYYFFLWFSPVFLKLFNTVYHLRKTQSSSSITSITDVNCCRFLKRTDSRTREPPI